MGYEITDFEAAFCRTVTEAMAETIKVAAERGLKEGAVVENSSGERWLISSVKMHLSDSVSPHNGQVIAFLAMKARKQLKSGKWGNHLHPLLHAKSLTVVGQTAIVSLSDHRTSRRSSRDMSDEAQQRPGLTYILGGPDWRRCLAKVLRDQSIFFVQDISPEERAKAEDYLRRGGHSDLHIAAARVADRPFNHNCVRWPVTLRELIRASDRSATNNGWVKARDLGGSDDDRSTVRLKRLVDDGHAECHRAGGADRGPYLWRPTTDGREWA